MAVALAQPATAARPAAEVRAADSTGRRAELHWLALVGVLLLALCAAPYLISTFAGPPDLVRSGPFWFDRDTSQYQAAMREGAESASWLIHDHFTAEPHAPVLMYPMYVGLGKLAATLHLDADTVFTAAEWLSRIALVAALYVFAATFLRDVKQRRLALLLTVGTLGLAGWAVPLRLIATAVNAQGMLVWLPEKVDVFLEISSFGEFLSAPHLMLGLALTLLSAPLYLRARSGSPRWLAALGANFVVLSLVHPFNVPVPVTIIGADCLLHTRSLHPRHWRQFLPAVVAGLACAPVAFYNLYLFQFDLFWAATYGSQNKMPSPALWELPFDLGIVLLVAPFAWRAVRAWPVERRRLLLLWIGLTVAWMYVPVPYQRRFGLGLQPAVAILGAVGLLAINSWMRVRHWGGLRRRLANYGFAALALMTSVLVYVSLLVSAATNQPSEVYLWTRAESDAGVWLGVHSHASDVVMASTLYANALVGVMDGRVVHGHIVATRQSDLKQGWVEQFYAAGTTPEQRLELLRESGATIVALGPRERAMGATEQDMAAVPGLAPIYNAEGVIWYRVQPGAA